MPSLPSPGSARAELLRKCFQQTHSGQHLLSEAQKLHSEWFRVFGRLLQPTCTESHLSSTAISRSTCGKQGSHSFQPFVPLLCRNLLSPGRMRRADSGVEVCCGQGNKGLLPQLCLPLLLPYSPIIGKNWRIIYDKMPEHFIFDFSSIVIQFGCTKWISEHIPCIC